jgi:hypothetical protein
VVGLIGRPVLTGGGVYGAARLINRYVPLPGGQVIPVAAAVTATVVSEAVLHGLGRDPQVQAKYLAAQMRSLAEKYISAPDSEVAEIQAAIKEGFGATAKAEADAFVGELEAHRAKKASK